MKRLMIERCDRHAEEERNAVLQELKGLSERRLPLELRPFHLGRVLDAPMRGHRVAGPDRAGFAGRVVANGEDEIHLGRTGFAEYVPRLRAEAVGWIAEARQGRQREWVDDAFWLAAGGKSRE